MTAIAPSTIDTARQLVQRQMAIYRYLDYYCDTPWARWLVEVLPDTFVPESGQFVPFADFHREFWEWVWSIEPNAPADAFVPCWARGHGKSSAVEAAFIFLAGERRRRYGLYCCSTQNRSDEHLANIAGLLEKPTVQRRYPDLCEKAMTQWGVSKGWNVMLIRTKQGFSMASVGLDKAVRGTRLDDQRPDLLAFDDVDSDRDSPHVVIKNERTITQAVLPTGDRGRLAVVFSQNIVHDNSVMARLLDNKSDFLRERRVSGPHPAIRDLQYEEKLVSGRKLWKVVSGTPTWQGLDIGDCERIINYVGIRSFLAEYQHQRDAKIGALWTREIIEACRAERPEHLVRITINVDPEASAYQTGSKTGITVTAKDQRGHGYLLGDHTDHYRGTTKGISDQSVDTGWGQKVVDLCKEWDADCVVAEVNQGGDMVRSIIHLINPNISIECVNAKRGKVLRADPVAQLYARGMVHHVGVFQELEDQMCEPYDPYHPTITWDNMDSAVYGFRYLLMGSYDSLPALDPNRHRLPRPTAPGTRPLPII